MIKNIVRHAPSKIFEFIRTVRYKYEIHDKNVSDVARLSRPSWIDSHVHYNIPCVVCYVVPVKNIRLNVRVLCVCSGRMCPRVGNDILTKTKYDVVRLGALRISTHFSGTKTRRQNAFLSSGVHFAVSRRRRRK